MQTTSSAQDREVRIARSSGLVRAIDDVRWVRIHGLLRALFADKVFETAAAPQYLKISVLAEEAHPRSVRIFSNALIFSNTGHTVLHSAVLVRKPTLLARLAPLIATATQHDRETLWEISGPVAPVSAHARLALRMPTDDAPDAFNVQPCDEGFDFTCPAGYRA